ncbi:MAG TPA: hypothetical protein VFM38_02140, partial [Candidatus Limnocylindrales bacterium]|nr:hypothetical protein [Candidatus Limnocylindrales bacterium]
TASTYQVNVSYTGEDPPPEGSVELQLTAEAVTDLGGNLGPGEPVAATVEWAADPEAPTVVLVRTPGWTYPKGEFLDWTMTFSEPMAGVELGDIHVGGPDAAEWTIGAIYGSGASYAFTTRQPVLSDGIFTVSFPEGAATDLAGNPAVASQVMTVTVDRTAPTTATPTIQLRSGVTLAGGSLRAQLTLAATDHGPAGMGTFEVRRSYDGRAFQTIATGVPPGPFDVTLAPGHSYRFEARAIDKAGNAGAWRAGATLRPALVQQTSRALRWSGSRGSASLSVYSGGSVRYLKAGASVSYTTKARGLAFVTTKGPNRGTARIYVDGVLAATVNLNAPTYTYRYVAFSRRWGSLTSHTIRVVSVGTPYGRVDVDAFAVIR